MQTEKTLGSIVFNPETYGGLLIRLYVAATMAGLGALVASLAGLFLGGTK